MDINIISALAKKFLDSDGNTIAPGDALNKYMAGQRLYETPLIGIASANDKEFERLSLPQALGEHFRMPGWWLDGAKTVISFFFPFTVSIKESNRADSKWPSFEWLYARIEGQALIEAFCAHVADELIQAGFKSVAPNFDPRLKTVTENPDSGLIMKRNWPERHVAFIAGLGTFGLSAGLITERGTAGRLGSVITTAKFPPTTRKYADLYEYCTMCGACMQNCPVDSITKEHGKLHGPCKEYLDEVKVKHFPRYGCGKCQVNAPCENGIPVKRHNQTS